MSTRNRRTKYILNIFHSIIDIMATVLILLAFIVVIYIICRRVPRHIKFAANNHRRVVDSENGAVIREDIVSAK